MNTKLLNNWINRIQVLNVVNADVEVVNKSPLRMLGKGRQGAVFQFSDDICVKVFGNTEDCDREHYALSLGQNTELFPKIHAKGPNYIAMDIVRGVDVREYLQSQPLTPALSSKLIEMLIIFKEIGFERIDHHKRQIYVQDDGSLKVIDVARTVWRDRVYPYPRKLLNSLGDENKALFLTHVKEMAPKLYEEWLHYIRMEEISHQIYQILLPEKPNKETLKNLSKKLLTTEDEGKYVLQLQGLVQKVFKEEWVKTMLARGKDPEAVMEKIDQYWDSLEQGLTRGRDRDRDRNRDRDRDRDKGRKQERRYEGEFRRTHDKHHHRGKRYEGERYRDRISGKHKSRYYK
ncbi:hypothetical protein [Neobacillus vireti]|uniref:Serine/threonine protein kinase n=1 Tax=Neobacillus vireti LMG 21834 TaxID=1131730 RepID=A0AB94IQJ6_9BACI|nr:hypothetical protein [Neobacillus vireti]ETI69314.1 hypothetical protein BAVI_07896 [Neobacillus vireti LMG 21834]KLT19853.1 hypothetical protein AA980_04670 [Neobacillus vireti]